MIQPAIPEDCRELWRVVAECITILNSLQNMTVRIEGKKRMRGRLDVKQGSCVLVIEELTEVGSEGT